VIKLYHAPMSRSIRIYWLLEELGIPYQLQVVEFQIPKVPFSQLTPLKKVPVLEDGDVTMIESGAMLEYLIERYGEGRLARAGAVVAKYSYGIYLWQVIALWVGFDIFGQTAFAARVAISITALAILAWGSYQLVEHPGVRLGARLADRFLQPAAPARARTATAP
jgi:glutathione S-transferase